MSTAFFNVFLLSHRLLLLFLQLFEVIHQFLDINPVHLSTLLNTLKESTASADAPQTMPGKHPQRFGVLFNHFLDNHVFINHFFTPQFFIVFGTARFNYRPYGK